MAHTFLPFPRHIQLQTHTKCNMACKCCPHPTLGLNRVNGQIDPELYERIVAEITTQNVFKEIVFDLQNEPLLDRALTNRIAELRRRRSDVFIGITTNGLLLTPNRFAELVDAGVSRVVVSLNALDAETFRLIDPKAKYDRIVENVSKILETSAGRKVLKQSFGITEHNRFQAADFIKQSSKNRHMYRVFSMHDRIGFVDNFGFSKIEVQDTCHIPLSSMAILCSGKVIMCCQDWVGKRVMGDLNHQSITEIWNSDEYASIRSKLLDRGVLPKDPCKGCKAPQPDREYFDTNQSEVAKASLHFFANEHNVTPPSTEQKEDERALLSDIYVIPRGEEYYAYSAKTGYGVSVSADVAKRIELEREALPLTRNLMTTEVREVLNALKTKALPSGFFRLNSIKIGSDEPIVSDEILFDGRAIRVPKRLASSHQHERASIEVGFIRNAIVFTGYIDSIVAGPPGYDSLIPSDLKSFRACCDLQGT